MFGIIGGLLGGWILALFNFDAVVIEGMMQLFGLAIDKTGYYFLFAIMGALKSVLFMLRGNKEAIKFKWDGKLDTKDKQ